MGHCRTIMLGLCLLVSASRLSAQENSGSMLRVFLDCPQSYCDLDYFRREIAFVDYVRDRTDADVHILVTSQSTGGGGLSYVATFIGQGRLGKRTDSLRYVAPNDATNDQRRLGLGRILKIGLLPFVEGSDAADRITIAYEAPAEGDREAEARRDPWNYWVFRTNASAYFNGESSYNNLDLFGSVSANRTTEQLKVSLSLNGNLSESNFEIDSTVTITSTSRSYSANGLVARSIGGQWAAGGEASARRSTYSNTKVGLRLAPGIEYDVFPYSESARRLLTIRYQIGFNHIVYDSTTIFFKDRETLIDESLQLSLSATQPWGSTGVGIVGSHYFDDFDKNSLRLFGNVNVRLVKGLSLRFNGSVSRVRDQRYLPNSGLTPEEVLLRQRAIATSYRYFGSVGLTYSFGSIFNNVVNPRFGGGGGIEFF